LNWSTAPLDKKAREPEVFRTSLRPRCESLVFAMLEAINEPSARFFSCTGRF
jgi:hypothetical protein